MYGTILMNKTATIYQCLKMRDQGRKIHEIAKETGLNFSEVYALLKDIPAGIPAAQDNPATDSQDTHEEPVEPEEEIQEQEEEAVEFWQEVKYPRYSPPPEIQTTRRRRASLQEKPTVVRVRPSFRGPPSLPSRDRLTTAFPNEGEKAEIVVARQTGGTLCGIAQSFNLPPWIIREVLCERGVR